MVLNICRDTSGIRTRVKESVIGTVKLIFRMMEAYESIWVLPRVEMRVEMPYLVMNKSMLLLVQHKHGASSEERKSRRILMILSHS